TQSNALSIVILAAGKGTRMKSDKAKVLHPVFYQPMAAHVITAAQSLAPLQSIAVIGHQADAVQQALTSALAPFHCDFAIQKEQRGTADAVSATESHLAKEAQTVLILCGDTPLIRPETLQQLYSAHQKSGSKITLLTTTVANPFGYGRIICDKENNITAIVEEKDASPEQKEICEINAGIYCVEKEFLFSALKQVDTNNNQKEMYLTDIISIAHRQGEKIKRFLAQDPLEVLGVNSRLELAEAERELQLRHNHTLMAAGVSMIAPETIRIAPTVQIAADTMLEPACHILGNTTIEGGCSIGRYRSSTPYPPTIKRKQREP
ncbi:glycosyl transferase family 2, partial [candidate division KSB3 bacterium]